MTARLRTVARLSAIAAILAAHLSAPKASAATLDFEGFPDSTILSNQYPGVIFGNTIILTSQYSLDEGEFPPRSGVNVTSDFGGFITMTFDRAYTDFRGYFTYATQLQVVAFDQSANIIPGTLTMSAFTNNMAVSGVGGSAPNELISLNLPGGFYGIAVAGDAGGGSFTMDDVTYTPEPGPAVLIGLPAAALFLLRKLQKRGRRAQSGMAAVLALCALGTLRAAPATFPASATPSTIPPNAATSVLVTATIADPTVIATTVILQQISSAGQITNPNLGLLHDDGLNGDAVAADGVYSLQRNFTLAAGSTLYQVSAGFQGSLRRVVSNRITLTGGTAFTGLMQTVGFTGGISITKDMVGGTSAITNPVWRSTNAPTDNNPAAYASGATMSADITFTLNPVPAAPIAGVTITGTIAGFGAFTKAGVTLPAAATATVTAIPADTAFPASRTRFFNPMSIAWSWSDGGPAVNLGTTTHQVYVTLAAPTNATVYLSDLFLGVANGGATDAASALANTWARFSTGGTGPANVTAWDGRQLKYYPAGIGFNGCAFNELSLLTAATGAGQCGSFAYLLIGALNVNGIGTTRVTVDAVDGTNFLVPNWMFGAQSLAAIDAAYPYRLTLNPLTSGSLDMVPGQPGGLYGDLTSQAGVAGQNSPTPSEKIFIRHFIVQPAASATYYDPSYGITYTGANNFENTAVVGYVKNRPAVADPDPGNQWRVRSSTGLANIQFH